VVFGLCLFKTDHSITISPPSLVQCLSLDLLIRSMVRSSLCVVVQLKKSYPLFSRNSLSPTLCFFTLWTALRLPLKLVVSPSLEEPPSDALPPLSPLGQSPPFLSTTSLYVTRSNSSLLKCSLLASLYPTFPAPTSRNYGSYPFSSVRNF